MKKGFLLFSLLIFVMMSARPFQTFVQEGQILLDTVLAVEYPAAIGQNDNHEWDFSALLPADAAPVVSVMERKEEKIILTEGDSRFYFDVRPDGNYFTGWESREKSVSLQKGYNQQPKLLVSESSHTTPYLATGEYSESGIATAISGAYSLEVVNTGALLLPDGRRFCTATQVKTIDRYHESGCNTTEVHIEKHLWYVPFYPLPVFVTVTAAYSYAGSSSDTLRSAWYTVNAIPEPIEIDADAEATFLFYPNPVEYVAKVIAPDIISHYRVLEVATGRVCMERSVLDVETAIQIDMQSLPVGAYILQIRVGNKWLSNKFIKAKQTGIHYEKE